MRLPVGHAIAVAVVLPACFNPDQTPLDVDGTTALGGTTQGGMTQGTTQGATTTGDLPTTDSGLDSDDTTTAGICGNGIQEADEECDDGNDEDGDGCLDTCQAARCGDGVVWVGREECDDGGESERCTADCTLWPTACGNGVVEAGEDCDDGNDVNTDDCLDTCVAASCGDGVVWAGHEACDDGNADEADGCSSTCVVPRSCGHIRAEVPEWITSGIHLIDPDAEGPGDPFNAYCDMSTDGGGWTLLAWVGDPSLGNRGLPYPGLAPCPGLACVRGSAVAPASIPPLFAISGSFALAHDPMIMAGYGLIGDYAHAGRYDYGDLTGLGPVYTSTSCIAQGPFAQGTFTTLVGPSDYDGATVYVSNGFTYGGYDYSLDTNLYIWSIGVTDSYCNGNGAMPGSYFGTWFDPSQEYGPYLPFSGGARSVWVR